MRRRRAEPRNLIIIHHWSTIMHKRPERRTPEILPEFDPGADRGEMGHDFLRALRKNFQRHGARRIKELSKKRPQDFLKLVLTLLPKQFRRKDVAMILKGASDYELARMMDMVQRLIAQEERKKLAEQERLAAEGAPPKRPIE